MGHVLVLGAGNGGLAAAADLSRRGFSVVLYNRSAAPLAPVQEQGGIRYEGVMGEGFAPIRLATTDLAEVVRDADLILACVPATAHKFLAQRLAPVLRTGQTIVLNPGGVLGSLAFQRELYDAGFRGRLWLGETGTLTYICRQTEPGTVRVTSVLRDVPFAALPGKDTDQLLQRVRPFLPHLHPVAHTLAAGLTNVNAVLHPPAMIFAAAWIEKTGGNFYYYYDAATPAVGRLLSALDRERIAVGSAWRVEVEPFIQLFARIGSTTPEAAASGDAQQVLLHSLPNRYIKAPPSLDHRYMHEDIPFGVAPLADLGRVAGVPVPTMEAVVTLASVATGRDYWTEARTLASLGLAGQTPDGVLRLLVEGEA